MSGTINPDGTFTFSNLECDDFLINNDTINIDKQEKIITFLKTKEPKLFNELIQKETSVKTMLSEKELKITDILEAEWLYTNFGVISLENMEPKIKDILVEINELKKDINEKIKTVMKKIIECKSEYIIKLYNSCLDEVKNREDKRSDEFNKQLGEGFINTMKSTVFGPTFDPTIKDKVSGAANLKELCDKALENEREKAKNNNNLALVELLKPETIRRMSDLSMVDQKKITEYTVAHTMAPSIESIFGKVGAMAGASGGVWCMIKKLPVISNLPDLECILNTGGVGAGGIQYLWNLFSPNKTSSNPPVSQDMPRGGKSTRKYKIKKHNTKKYKQGRKTKN